MPATEPCAFVESTPTPNTSAVTPAAKPRGFVEHTRAMSTDAADARRQNPHRFVEYKRVLTTNASTVALRNSASTYVAPGFQQTAVPPSALPATLASADWERVQLTSSSAPPQTAPPQTGNWPPPQTQAACAHAAERVHAGEAGRAASVAECEETLSWKRGLCAGLCVGSCIAASGRCLPACV